MNVTSWISALKYVKNNGGKFLDQAGIERFLCCRLPIKVVGCWACGERGGVQQFEQIGYIPLTNEKLRQRATRPPYAGRIETNGRSFSVIGLCKSCRRCCVDVEVIEGEPEPLEPEPPPPKKQARQSKPVREQVLDDLPDLNLRLYRQHKKRLIAEVSDPGSQALGFYARGCWFIVTQPYRHLKDFHLLPGAQDRPPAGITIVRGPLSLFRSVKLLNGRGVSLRLKQKIQSQIQNK